MAIQWRNRAYLVPIKCLDIAYVVPVYCQYSNYFELPALSMCDWTIFDYQKIAEGRLRDLIHKFDVRIMISPENQVLVEFLEIEPNNRFQGAYGVDSRLRLHGNLNWDHRLQMFHVYISFASG